MRQTWSFYEFFAGGGMARAGLGRSWECLLANDISEKKAVAYAANFGREHLKVGDIYDLTVGDLPGQADLAWGSFPCQDLSLAGAGAGLEGDRSGCFWGFWNLVNALNKAGRKPRVLVLENVFGALTSHDGADFEAIVSTIAGEGYRVGAMVIDAVHFVPQSRPRLFIVAINASFVIPSSLLAPGATPSWHPDALIRAYNRLPKRFKESWLWLNPPPPERRQDTLEDLVEAEPHGVVWHTEAETNHLLRMMSPVNRQKVLKVQSDGVLRVGTIYRRTRLGVQRAEVRFDGVAGCLRTPTGGSSRQTIIVVDGPTIRTRLLSPREAARLMGLDDDYILPTRYNDAYHVAGDGVVVSVVSHLARTVLEPVLIANASKRDGAPLWEVPPQRNRVAGAAIVR